jgi:hypothetical protein
MSKNNKSDNWIIRALKDGLKEFFNSDEHNQRDNNQNRNYCNHPFGGLLP